MSDAKAEEGYVLRTKSPLFLVFVVAGIFGLLYAYTVWSGVASFIKVAGSVALAPMGVFLFWLPIVVPVLVYAFAFFFGYRRKIGEFALILLAGLALVEVFWLNMLALFGMSGTTYLAG